MSPPPGKHWQYTPKTLEEMDARGEIYWSPTGKPRRKGYLCLLYTSDAAGARSSVDLGGRRIINNKNKIAKLSMTET